MSPIRHEGSKQVPIQSWEGYVEQTIREAQARGEFDNLPGAGKPIDLGEENPFEAEWGTAYRLARNAGAVPLWVELDREIAEEAAALQAMLQRTAAYVATQASRLRQTANATESDGGDRAGRPNVGPARQQPHWWSLARWWRSRPTPHSAGSTPPGPAPLSHLPPTLAALEQERLRARSRYLAMAAALDRKIVEYNAHRPRRLSWMEKPRLLTARAARQFDTACPPVIAERSSDTPSP